MMRTIVLLIFLIPCSVKGTSYPLPSIIDYKLYIDFQLEKQRVSVKSTMVIKNTTSEPVHQLPFLLYRLLIVDSVRSKDGLQLPFTQQVVSMTDESTFQVNAITVELPRALQPQELITLSIRYDGFMLGYQEVMNYVRDRIDANYSLLRPDAFAWPVIATPSFESVFGNETKFTYAVGARVPEGYRVAVGGKQLSTTRDDHHSTFTFAGKVPTWRIDVAVAKFNVLENKKDQLSVFFLPEDLRGAKRVMKASAEATKFYSEVFGSLEPFPGYTVIEIPDQWGSQAGDYYFLQTAAAFQDSTRLHEVYHEIAHSWNVPAKASIQQGRYFDEAFASFFAMLAIRHLEGEHAFSAAMEKLRERFIASAAKNPAASTTPIRDYSSESLGGLSYTKGAWSLFVLYSIVGEKNFSLIIRNMRHEFKTKDISFEDFKQLCENTTKRKLDMFFKEWIDGNESSRLLIDGVGIEAIVKRY